MGLFGQNPVVGAAIEAGMDMNSKINGIALTKAVHTGSHPNYTRAVQDQLTNWMNANPNFTPQQAKSFIESTLIPDLINLIKKQPRLN